MEVNGMLMYTIRRKSSFLHLLILGFILIFPSSFQLGELSNVNDNHNHQLINQGEVGNFGSEISLKPLIAPASITINGDVDLQAQAIAQGWDLGGTRNEIGK